MQITVPYSEKHTKQVDIMFPLYMSYEYHPDYAGSSQYNWMRIELDDPATLRDNGMVDGVMHSISMRPAFRKNEFEWKYERTGVNVAIHVGSMLAGGNSDNYRRSTAKEFFDKVDEMTKAIAAIPAMES